MRSIWRYRSGTPGSGGKGTRRDAAALLLAALAAGGCSEALSPGGVAPAGGEARLAATSQPGSPFQPNSVRYRDSGGRPVSARSGGHAASVFAIADATGRTEVLVAAYSAANPAAPRPVLTQVQLKAYDADGRLRHTRNETPEPGTSDASYLLGGLARGHSVQLQATLRGGGAARTGVVTVAAPVLLRPNLRVEAVSAPLRAAANTMVRVSALIRETNGDLGARAHCSLRVDGVEVDRAWGVWVDAGGAVSCVFAHMFRQPGVVPVEVRLLDVTPRDFDPADNAATAHVEVIAVPSAFEFNAQFEDRTFESVSSYSSSWIGPGGAWGMDSEDESESRGRTQDAYLWAWMPRAVTFPLAELFVRQYTRDETVHGARFTDLVPDWSYENDFEARSCLTRYNDDANGRAWLELCAISFGGGAFEVTAFSYSRYAGDVAYRSRGHSRYWNRELGYDDVWSWNYDDAYAVGRFASYGLQYAFYAQVEDASGVFTMNPFVWLEPFAEEFDSPRTCDGWSDEWGTSQSCWQSRHVASGVRGWVFGLPTP